MGRQEGFSAGPSQQVWTTGWLASAFHGEVAEPGSELCVEVPRLLLAPLRLWATEHKFQLPSETQ